MDKEKDEIEKVDEILETKEDSVEDILNEREETSPSDSSTEKEEEKKEEEPKKEVAFHEHPRRIERERDWKKRMAEQEATFTRKLEQVEAKLEKKEVPDFFVKAFGEDKNLYNSFETFTNAQKELIKAELIAEQQKEEETQQQVDNDAEEYVKHTLAEQRAEGKRVD